MDLHLAEGRLMTAINRASSARDLDKDWLEIAAVVSSLGSKSFTPMLGTALLAKATNDAVSALALKSEHSHNAYSARTLAHHVLVPVCERHGINLRTTGAEPLNNQPFFRYSVVSREMKVRSRRDLEVLVAALEKADFLRGEEALGALASFIRVRMDDPVSIPTAVTLTESPSLPAVLEQTRRFVLENPEGGKRGEAIVAAAFDLVFDDVRVSKVNDPSTRRRRNCKTSIVISPGERRS